MNDAALWQRTWPAPAKINLFLHVVGRRDDGYHLLQTVFRFIDCCDQLRFSPRDDDQVVLVNPLPGVPADSDLTVRAARALQAAVPTARHKGVVITLEKHLPMGGGLGGGSSDAATVLLALNTLWQCGLSRPELEAIGLGLGADVPVFIHGQSTFAEGIGERFIDVAVPDAWYLVLVPPVAVPTPEIFRAPDLRRDTPTMTPTTWRHGQGSNDLEPVACRLYPEVARHLVWLRSLPEASLAAMSGSGACCFAEFATEAAARSAHGALPPDMKGFVAQGLHQHPILC